MRTFKILLIIFTVMVSINAYSTSDKQENFINLHIINHPLIQHKLTLMREKDTGTYLFSELLQEIAMLMGYEVTHNLKTHLVKIETPVARTIGKMIEENQIVIVPILRAGLGMADGLRKLIPTARVGHIGLYRDPKTKKPVEYMLKLPKINGQTFIVVDPMMATGNSAVHAVQRLIDKGVLAKNIIFMALVVAPEGVRTFQKAYPNIPIFAAGLDKKLNDHAYIVPGLGDAGDRLFGTK